MSKNWSFPAKKVGWCFTERADESKRFAAKLGDEEVSKLPYRYPGQDMRRGDIFSSAACEIPKQHLQSSGCVQVW